MSGQILVPVTGSDRDDVALAAAFAVASRLEAHVLAVFAHADPREGLTGTFTGRFGLPTPISPELIETIIDLQTATARDAEQEAHKRFLEAANTIGATVVERPSSTRSNTGLTCSFRAQLGYVSHTIASTARLADLVAFGPLAVTDGVEMKAAFVDVLTKIARPVLLANKIPERPFARRISIGWDGSTAAAHAVTAALPLLKLAASVELLVIRKSYNDPLDKVKDYLAAHRVVASSHTIDAHDISVGEMLLEAASACRSDLLVIGGYGHSQWQEMIFGGPTKHIISHPTLPILLMH